MEYIVLIRRFIRPERADEFEAWHKTRPPVQHAGFLGKTLSRLNENTDLPAGLNSFHVAGNPGCVTFIMIERWQSIDEFRRFVPNASTADQDEFEMYPRQRVILSAV